MIRLALSSLRFRLGGVVAILLAVAVGSALLTAAGGLLQTAIRLDAPPQRLAGAPIVVTGPTDFRFPDGSGSAGYSQRAVLDPGVAGQLGAIDGVAAAVPDVSFPAAVVRRGELPVTGGDLLAGHAWASAALTPYALTGAPPRSTGDVVVDTRTARQAGLHPGDRVPIAVDGRTTTFTVTGIARPARPVDAPALFFVDGRGHAPNAIGIIPTAGTATSGLAARIDATLPAGLQARTGDDRGRGEFGAISSARLRLIIVAGVFGGLVLVVMALVISGSVTLSVRRRHRELALLRAGGATQFQVRRLVIDEVLVVAVAGVAVGLVGGWLLGRPGFRQLVEHGIAPAGLQFGSGPIPLAAAAVVGLLAARVTAGLAARPAARVTPIQALQEAAIPDVEVRPARRFLAAVFAVGTVGLAGTTLFLSPTDASALGGPAGLTGAIAVALLAPAVLSWSAARLRRVPRTGVIGRLAAVNLQVRAVQFGAVLVPIVLATSIAVGNVYSQTSQNAAARSAALDPLRADLVVTSSVGGVAPGLTDRLAAVPGVRSASELVVGEGWIERPFDHSHTSDAWPLLGISAQGAAPAYTAKVRAGTLATLRGNTAALPAAQAADLGVEPGDRVRIRFGDGGAVDVDVVALIEQRAGYERLVVPARLLAAHTTAGLPSDVLLRTDGSGHVRADVARLVAGWPGTQVGDRSMLASEFEAGLDMQAWLNYLIAALAIAYAALATVNSLAVSILDRRREFGLQILTGATRRQVVRMVCAETGVVALLAFGIGTAVAAFTVLPITVASGDLLPSGPVWVYPAIAGALAVVIAPVAVLATRVALRSPPTVAVAGAGG